MPDCLSSIRDKINQIFAAEEIYVLRQVGQWWNSSHLFYTWASAFWHISLCLTSHSSFWAVEFMVDFFLLLYVWLQLWLLNCFEFQTKKILTQFRYFTFLEEHKHSYWHVLNHLNVSHVKKREHPRLCFLSIHSDGPVPLGGWAEREVVKQSLPWPLWPRCRLPQEWISTHCRWCQKGPELSS